MSLMYNVTSGPAVYPKAVLEKLAQGVINFQGEELSMLELGHRSELFLAIRDELISLTRELLEIPNDYSIMYLQGGGRLHFAQIPMNFLNQAETVQFIDTGYWSTKAAEYSQCYGNVQILTSSKDKEYTFIPEVNVLNLSGKYLQYCANNTIYGTQFRQLPTSNIPVVVDMSSEIFSRKLDWSCIHVMLACAQKNFGPAGLSLLVIKNDFLATAKSGIPAIFDYKNLAAKNSNYNTPPIFNICASLEMLKWMKEKGGVSVLEKETNQRASLLYGAMDNSQYVKNCILKEHRSTMNVVFDAISPEAEKIIMDRFKSANVVGMRGHKTRGGFRVANYIAQDNNTIECIAEILKG